MIQLIQNLFHLKESDTDLLTEVIAGTVTFMTMAYIYTNYPFALAPGMGLNAFLTYGVVLGLNLPWQVGMSIVFVEGTIIFFLVLTNILLVDSLAAVIGGAFGCSSVTTYVESAAGVSEGGRTGLTSDVTASLFFSSIFFWPLMGIIPPIATAPALVTVGFLMMMIVKDIEWSERTEAFPAFLTIITIPLTFSISKGIGYGPSALWRLRYFQENPEMSIRSCM